jgi:hypothetical protein
MPAVDGTLFADGDGCLALSQNGVTELDAAGAVRRTAIFDQGPLYFSRAAFNGTNFFLFDGIVGTGFRGRIVDRNAHVLSTAKLPITEDSSSDAAVTASADGGFTIIVADVVEGIYAMQINAAGQMSGSKVDLFSPGNRHSWYMVTVAANAGQTLVAWTTFGSNFVHTVALRNGAIVQDNVLPPTVERSRTIELLPSGSGFILLRNANVDTVYSVLAYRLDANGLPRDAAPAVILDGGYSDAGATSRRLVLLGARNGSNGTLIEVSAAITASGIVPEATYDVTATAVRQIDPVVASDGVYFFSAWIEKTSSTIAIVAGRVTRSGLPLDGTGVVVAELPASLNARPLSTPSVAFGAGVYLVVFAYGPNFDHTVMGRRYARDGTPIDPAPFLITRSGIEPSVAFGGGHFLVAWELISSTQSNPVISLAGATVEADRTEGPEQLLTPAPSLQLPEETGVVGRPRIAWNGRHFIIAYDLVQENASNIPLAYRVRVLRASPAGTPVDGHTFNAVEGAAYSTIACSEQECMVIASRLDAVVAAAVHDDGGLRADAPKIIPIGQASSWGAVAFDGASYLLAWRAGDSVVGVTRISRGGVAYAPAVAGTRNAKDAAPVSPPDVAVNLAGDTAIVTTEFNTVWLIDRARFYFASEFPTPRKRATR